MKKLALVLGVSLFASSFAQAETCANAEAKALAAKARDRVLRMYEILPDESLAVMDVTDAQVANCPAKYVAHTLGMPTTAEVRPDVCGVRLKFKTAEAEKNFATYMMMLGGKINVTVDGQTESVPVCGKVAQ